MTIDDVLANMPGLMGAEQDWLRKHPDLVLDQAKNRRLTVYFDEGVERGLERSSPDFQRTSRTASASATMVAPAPNAMTSK